MKQMNGGFEQSKPLVRSGESVGSRKTRSGRERRHQARQRPNHIIASMVEERRLLASPLGERVGEQSVRQRFGPLVGGSPRDTETALLRSLSQCLDQTALADSSLSYQDRTNSASIHPGEKLTKPVRLLVPSYKRNTAILHELTNSQPTRYSIMAAARRTAVRTMQPPSTT